MGARLIMLADGALHVVVLEPAGTKNGVAGYTPCNCVIHDTTIPSAYVQVSLIDNYRRCRRCEGSVWWKPAEVACRMGAT